MQRNTIEELLHFVRAAQPRKRRSIREFAEQDIIVPDGDFKGEPFRCERQPFSGVWFDAIDSGKYSRFVATGPTQSGKSLTCYVIPTLYHLFEEGERVIGGLPDMRMCNVKWRTNFLPAIQASRFSDLLPLSGGGSRGGNSGVFYFANGASLLFLTGGGDDKSRASYTARVISITETDGLDEIGTTSREADKVTQIEARADSFEDRKRVYLECTVSFDTGRTWREYTKSTCTRLALPCPHCRAWVTPEREHLVGWQDAESEIQAREEARFVCPNCGSPWTERERVEANLKCRGVHKDQTITPEGTVEGPEPQTKTFGLRWTAVNNLFWTTAYIAAQEWLSRHARDAEAAEKGMLQFRWALPVKSDPSELSEVDTIAVMHRQATTKRGEIPQDAVLLTTALDIGKFLAHWVAIAWAPGATGTVIDYGRIEVPSAEMDEAHAVLIALREYAEICRAGWNGIRPREAWIDAGYCTDTVFTFVREISPLGAQTPTDTIFRASFGRGASQQNRTHYIQPSALSQYVPEIGDGYYIKFLEDRYSMAAFVDSDQWKSWVHARFRTPVTGMGAMKLFAVPKAVEHTAFAHHLAAERGREEFVAGKGLVVKWEKVRRSNHWLDASYLACACGHYCGARLHSEDSEALVGLPPGPRPERVEGMRGQSAATSRSTREVDSERDEDADLSGGWFSRRGRR